MKLLLAFTIIFFAITGSITAKENIIKIGLVFKGIENTGTGWQLKFADKTDKIYLFNAQRSNTVPYIFYSKAKDGSMLVNEKIKDNWFLVSYVVFIYGKHTEKVIMKIEAVKA